MSRVLVVALATFAFTILCVEYSKSHGRLSSVPLYDDVTYFFQGATLLHSFEKQGSGGLNEFLLRYGLHTPFSTGLAAVSYQIFGRNDSSPYYGNAIVILLYLSGVTWFLRRLPFTDWICCLVLFLAPPIATMAIVEFRPDIGWAFVIGFGVVWLVTTPAVFSGWKASAFAGVIVGLALLIKPTTFAMTGILFFGAIASRALSMLYATRSIPPVRTRIAGTAVFLLVIACIAGPYVWFFGAETWQYFYLNSFGINKSAWAFHGGSKESMLYYISGEAGHSNLAYSGALLVFLGGMLSAVGTVYVREIRLKLIFLLLAILGAWLVNTSAAMKSPFLGGAIYGTLLFSCAYLISQFYEKSASNPLLFLSKLRTPVLVIFAALALVFYRWPLYTRNLADDQNASRNFKNAREFINAELSRYAAAPPKQILFGQAGPIVKEGVGLWLLENNIKCGLLEASFIRTLDGFRHTYPLFDWVILQEQGVVGSFPNMPSEALLPGFLQIVSTDPNYHRIAEFADSNGKNIFVYARKDF